MTKVIPIDPDRAEAVRWLQSRLAWEDTLRALRHRSTAEPARPEAPVAA